MLNFIYGSLRLLKVSLKYTVFAFLVTVKIGLWINGKGMLVNVLAEDQGDPGLSSSSATESH